MSGLVLVVSGSIITVASRRGAYLGSSNGVIPPKKKKKKKKKKK
jgi:hypothetical protein